MEKILFVNACIRENSRTLELARYVLSHLEGQVEEVCLNEEKIPALDREGLSRRTEALELGALDDPALRYARQFRRAETIVIAAPYYDLSFPSCLKNYLEAICCVGLTFFYDEQERPQTLCAGKRLIYVTTGGGAVWQEFGYGYVKRLFSEFFHIHQAQFFCAERLDLLGSEPDVLMEAAKRRINRELIRA